MDFPDGSDRKASAYNAGDLGSIPGSGRSPGEGNGNLLQYSCPPPKRGAQCIPWESAYVTNQSFFPQRTVTSTSIPKPSMHLSDHCLLNTNCVPPILLDTKDTAVRKTNRIPTIQSLPSNRVRSINNYINQQVR